MCSVKALLRYQHQIILHKNRTTTHGKTEPVVSYVSCRGGKGEAPVNICVEPTVFYEHVDKVQQFLQQLVVKFDAQKIVVALDCDALSLLESTVWVVGCIYMDIPFWPVSLMTTIWADVLADLPFRVITVFPSDANKKPEYKIHLSSHGTITLSGRPLTVSEVTMSHTTTVPPPEPVLYVITTSGTTAKSKPIFVTDSSILPNIHDFRKIFEINNQCGLFISSPLTFDPSILQLLLALTTGATIIGCCHPLTTSQCLMTALQFVTHMQVVPSYMRYLGNEFISSYLLYPETTLRVLSFGGEQCPTPEELHVMCSGKEVIINSLTFYNCYGMTEQSVWSTCYQISSERIIRRCMLPVPIGKPLSETNMTIAECNGEDENHLILSSSTRHCFTPNDSKPMETISTGDIVRKTDNGDFIYVGRNNTDFVKVGGTRISLPLLEKTCCAIHGVTQAGAYYDDVMGVQVAFSGSANQEDILIHITSQLPGVYVPSRCVKLPKLPLSRHGKLDRAGIARMLELNSTGDLSALFKECIGSNINVHATFIENGGTSIQAIYLNRSKCHEPLHEENSAKPAVKRRCTEEKNLDFDLKAVTNSLVDLTGVEFIKAINRGGFNVCTKEASSGVSTSEMRWKIDTKKCIDASPTCLLTKCGMVMVYIGSHSGIFLCSSVYSGEVIWEVKLGGRIEATAISSNCLNYVIVGCYDGILYFLCARTGSEYWRYKTGDVIKCTPAVQDHMVYTGSHDHHIYALDMKEKTLQWKLDVEGGIYASPVLVRDNLIVSTLSGCLKVLNKINGGVLHSLLLSAAIFSTPVLHDDNCIVCCVDGNVCRVNVDNLQVHHICRIPGPLFSTPLLLLNQGCLLVGCHDKNMYCLDLLSQHISWSQSFTDTMASQCCYCGKDEVLAMSSDGTLSRMNVVTGSSTVLYKSPGSVFGSPVLVGQTVIFGSRDNNLYCLDIT